MDGAGGTPLPPPFALGEQPCRAKGGGRCRDATRLKRATCAERSPPPLSVRSQDDSGRARSSGGRQGGGREGEGATKKGDHRRARAPLLWNCCVTPLRCAPLLWNRCVTPLPPPNAIGAPTAPRPPPLLSSARLQKKAEAAAKVAEAERVRLAHEAHSAELMKKEEERKRKHEEEEAAAAAKKKALEEARRLYTPSHAVTSRYLPLAIVA